MKKLMILFTLLMVTICSSVSVFAIENDYSEKIRSFIYTFDDKIENVSYIRNLNDIFGNESYQLYSVGEDGYAIVTIETQNILEINYSNMPSNTKTYYTSPGEFLSDEEFLSASTSLSISSLSYDDEDDSDSIYDVTSNILNQEHVEFEYAEENDIVNGNEYTRDRPYPTLPSPYNKGTAVGIPNANMDIFNGSEWVSTNNRCGAWTAAVLITYMDKYYGGNYFKESGSYSEGKIISRLTSLITGSSNANQFLNAINTIFLKDYPNGGKHGTVTRDFTTINSKISSKRPVALLLQTFLGSGYKDHWVCAYQYVKYDGATWYHVHDNWSSNNHRGWILIGWVYKGVYTN